MIAQHTYFNDAHNERFCDLAVLISFLHVLAHEDERILYNVNWERLLCQFGDLLERLHLLYLLHVVLLDLHLVWVDVAVQLLDAGLLDLIALLMILVLRKVFHDALRNEDERLEENGRRLLVLVLDLVDVFEGLGRGRPAEAHLLPELLAGVVEALAHGPEVIHI